MDKYQERIMKTIAFCISYDDSEIDKDCFDKKEITVKQLDDIAITKYDIHIYPNTSCDKTCIEKAYAVTGEMKEPLKNEEFKSGYSVKKRYVGLLDFGNRISAIELCFKNDLAEPLTIPVKYIEADKEKYYAKKEQERKVKLLKAAEIKVSTGADLVNIYFQPCCDKYEYTEIQFFIPKEYETVGGPYGPIQNPSSWSLIKKVKVSTDDFYKSIHGLAYGTYSFILKQFDSNDNLLLETENITFTISRPPEPDEYIPYTII